MRNLIQLSCFLLINIAAVCSLQCTSCTKSDALECTGETLVTCSATDDACTATFYSETRGDKVTTSWVISGCGNMKQCTDPDILTNANVRVVTGAVCCKEDKCVNKVTLPAAVTTANNLMCSSCYSASAQQCNPNGTVRCTGTENRCARFSIENQGDKTKSFSTRGCATEGFCSKNIAVIEASNTKIVKDCTSASTHLQRNLFLLFASLIFLVKSI